MHRFYVKSNQRLTPTTLLLSLEKYQKTNQFRFVPGQYAAINFRNKGRPTTTRCFSIASSPNDEILQFSIRTKGKFTSALANLKEGDEVKVIGPFGNFVIDPKNDNENIMIAGGIGIAPFMSMVKYATDNNSTKRMNLIYSCSTQDDVPFYNRIVNLSEKNSNFKTNLFISNGPINKLANMDVQTNRITCEAIDQVVNNDYQNKKFYICGPPTFMNAMTKILHSKGLHNNQIITESFSQAPSDQGGKSRSWPNNIYFLGAAGIALASIAIMVKDLLDTIPASNYTTPSSMIDSTYSTNSRQAELDNLVNNLPVVTTSTPATEAVTKNDKTATNTTTTVVAPTINTPVVTNPITPAPTPKCTTTQSGVTTCI